MSKKSCKVEEYDYVIVGLGTAGSPLARYLSEDRKTKVLVIEGGRNRQDDPDVLAVDGGASTDPRPELHWFWPADVSPAIAPPNIFANYTEGRMWGGSSGHNFHLTVRGSPDVYNQAWAAVNPRWSYNNLLPFMRFLETYTPAPGWPANFTQRGRCGPLCVAQEPGGPPIADGLAQALAVAANAPFITDYNDPTLGDVGTSAGQLYVCFDPNTPSGIVRSWSAPAFVRVGEIVDERGNGLDGRRLKIVSAAVADRVLFEEKRGRCPRATAVVYSRHGCDEIVEARARCKVILSSGAISTPQILQRSGIGDRAKLEALGIDVVFDNPNVGRHLLTHYGPITVFPTDPNNPPSFASDITFFDLSGNNLGPPTGIREFQMINVSGDPGVVVGLLFDMRPKSEGFVEIRDKNPTFEPLVDFELYSNPEDLARAVAALKVMANVSLQYTGQMPFVPDASAFPAGEYPGGASPGDQGLIDYILTPGNVIFTNHAGSTARMSKTAADGVVDGDLDVHGVTGLGVADNSIVPKLETGNTAWQAYIIGLVKAEIECCCVPTGECADGSKMP